jgi:thiamine biosynthesis lipoprotein
VRARGESGRNQAWRIGIERPDAGERAVQRAIPLRDLAMATSGDYRNFREVDGQRVSHTMDPRTGRPARHALASVTVLHPHCARADAYATALMVLGPEAGPALAEERGLAALFLVHAPDGAIQARETPAFGRLAGEREGG